MFNSRRKFFTRLLARADAARDERRHDAASVLYEECLRLRPRDAGLAVQCGHMHKESGRLTEAEGHYLAALQSLPDDADLALQLGHLYKVQGRQAAARAEYRRALKLQPDWAVARTELDGLRADLSAAPTAGVDETGEATADDATATPEGVARERLVPGLAPRRPDDLLVKHAERIEVRLGRREAGAWGVRRTLRGIEAVHGVILSEAPLVDMAVMVDGISVDRESMHGGYRVENERDPGRIAKYVFNRWIDFSTFAPGIHAVDLRFRDADGERRRWHDVVVIAPPVPEEQYPDSDFLIAPPLGGKAALEAWIRSRPSQIHQARRSLFPCGVRTVLVMRTDQLGDLVSSIPAVRRLRTIVPDARIVGLVTPANADLAATLTDLFDEVIVIDFPDLPSERRRVMPLAQQAALRERLEPYRFDIAVDLSRAGVSRELLLLSGAGFLCGVGGGDWPFLSLDVVFNTHDRWTGHDMTPHSVQARALVEVLGSALEPPAPIVRRADLSRDRVGDHGIGPDDRYVVLHVGARISFSRWPHFAQLARLLLDRGGVRVVAIGEDAGVGAAFADDLLADPSFVLLDRRLDFDELDALLSFATVMVGNDSGPKHLAALRGTPVVTIFSARINWTEWGQENVGVIVSRKVPCAGCAIHHDAENCGKDFACIVDIRPEEVFAETVALMEQARA